MRLNLWVTCNKCGKQGSIRYCPKGLEEKPGIESVKADRKTWQFVDCSVCKAKDSLILKATAGKQLITVGMKREGAKFGPVREKRVVPVKGKGTDSDYVNASKLEMEMGEGGDLEDSEDDERDDPTIKEPQSRPYKGTLGRLNTKAYPVSFTVVPAALGPLKAHPLQTAKQIGEKVDRGAQGVTMRAHYVEPGPLAKKTFLKKLFVKQGKKERVLSATLFAEFFMENDPALKGVFDGKDDHHSMEWCHALACSLGGDSSFKNLFAASYDANTFSACIEDWLRWNRNNATLYMWLTVHYQTHGGDYSKARTSCRRAPAFFTYCIADNVGKTKAISFYVDCRCIGFNRANYDEIHKSLNTHFAIKKADRME